MRFNRTIIILLLLIAVFLLTSCGPSTSEETTAPEISTEPEISAEPQESIEPAEPETYSATGSGHENGLTVTIEVIGGTVVGCEINASKETPGVGGIAAAKLQTQIIDGAMPQAVDVIVGATETCSGIIELYKDCLDQAGISY